MTQLRRTVLYLLAILTGIAATAHPARAAALQKFDIYLISSGSSGLCLSNLNQNGRIAQDRCDAGQQDQLWTWQQVAGDNMWKIRNYRHENSCISTVDGAIGYLTPLDLWGCTSSRRTLRWNFKEVADPVWRIKSPWVNGCFDIARRFNPSDPVILGECNPTNPDETWVMRRVGFKYMEPLPF